MLGNRLKKNPGGQPGAVARSAFQCDSAEAQGAAPGPCCPCQHRPSLSAERSSKTFSVPQFIPCQANGISAKSPLSLSLLGKSGWGKEKKQRTCFLLLLETTR